MAANGGYSIKHFSLGHNVWDGFSREFIDLKKEHIDFGHSEPLAMLKSIKALGPSVSVKGEAELAFLLVPEIAMSCFLFHEYDEAESLYFGHNKFIVECMKQCCHQPEMLST